MGTAIPFTVGRHVHPSVPQAVPQVASEPTGIDYLGLVEPQRSRPRGRGRSSPIEYRELHLPGFSDEGADREGAQ